MDQLTQHDIRNLAVAIDGGGNEFIAYTEGPGYDGKVMRIAPNGTRSIIHTLPGDKTSTMHLAVVGANLRVYAGIRMTPTSDGFPLFRYDVPGACVPFAGAAPVLAAPAPSVVVAVDAQARQDAAAAQRMAQGADARARQAQSGELALAGQVGAIEAGALGSGLIGAIRDVLFSGLPDALYALLRDRNAGVVGEIRAIVAEGRAEPPAR